MSQQVWGNGGFRDNWGSNGDNFPRRPVDYVITEHALVRLAQRNLTQAEVDYVLQNGSISYVGHARIYFLRRIDIPADDRHIMNRLEGTAVVMTPKSPRILTVWRSRRNGLKHIRRKLAHLSQR